MAEQLFVEKSAKRSQMRTSANTVQCRSKLDNWGGGSYSYIRVHRP